MMPVLVTKVVTVAISSHLGVMVMSHVVPVSKPAETPTATKTGTT